MRPVEELALRPAAARPKQTKPSGPAAIVFPRLKPDILVVLCGTPEGVPFHLKL
jgi:hypothetical protein